MESMMEKLCGTRTDTGMIYTEIILKKENFTMNSLIKAGHPTALKDLISYEEGSIVNLDVVHADNMKFVLMAFDEGTGLTPHRAPGNAILTALEGKAKFGFWEKFDDTHTVVRIATSWATRMDEVEALIDLM